MIIKREDLKVAGRIVSTSTECVVCDSSQVFSEDYVKKYGRQPQFSTDGFQSTINDKLIELYKSIQNDVKNSVKTESITTNAINIAINDSIYHLDVEKCKELKILTNV